MIIVRIKLKMQFLFYLIVFASLVKSEFLNSTDSTSQSENLIGTPCTDQNHLFLAPGVLTAGGTNRACISRFFPEGPAHLRLALVTEDGQTVTVERDLPSGDGGCVDIAVPLLPNTKADLVTSVEYPACTWRRRITLRIASGRVVVVHTERARYRPGEMLRARVFALKADLTPAHGMVEEIWIEGPPGAWEGTRVAQWTRVRSKMGLAQIQHQIDELAPEGRWTVRARLGDGSQGSATVWVGNYDVPPFQLSVRHSPRILRTSERLVWTVCVRYPWTEAVEGMLVIRLLGVGSASAGVRTAVRLRAPRACHRHAAAAARVGLAGPTPPAVVRADFSFQEEGTRVWQNTTVVSQVVDKPIYLEFVTKDRTVVALGLPYKLKVKATRWDYKPAVGERIRVCRYSSSGQAAEINTPTCNSGNTDAGGVARVMFAAEDDGTSFYRFEANLSNDTSIQAPSLTLATRRSKLQAALGPLRADSKSSKTFVPLYLNLRNVTTAVTVHFVVIVRGGIIYRWGATTQCPISSSSNHVQIAARNSRCHDAMSLTKDNHFDKNNANYDRLSDYYNRIVSRQRTKSENEKNANKNINNDANKNKNQDFNEYFSRYVNQLNKTVNTDNNKVPGRNDINSNGNINTFNTNLNHDTFTETKTESNDNSNDINHGFDKDNASDALLDRHLLRIMLPIKVTQQMCPDSHLIAYFYHNGEFVSASKHFEMDDCFVNKVDLSWQSRQTLPGSIAGLHVSFPGPALCALTVVDTAFKLTPMATVKDIITTGLRNMMDAHRNLSEYDAAGDCFLNEDIPEMPANNLELTASWLASAGIRTLGDMPSRRQCNPAAMTDEGTISRSDFSEAWLWRLVTVGSNGTMMTSAKAPDSITRFEANAVCLTKAGVSVAQPAVLQVFREFFIHADSPRRLRRGDKTIVKYRLFNYLYEPLSVQIQILTDPHIRGPSEVVESVCIPPRASTARRAEVTASGVGEGRVIVRAKAVSDGGCGTDTNERGVGDEVVIRITVEPEGVPVHEQKSTLLCGKAAMTSLSSKSEVSWSWSPVDAVPGTESLTVWAIGNITGPLLADADSLVLLPRGCGEQNMARLATNLLALSHLHPSSAAAATAREHVARGLTRQLQYIHPSGGFSAFGPSDPVASTWLTAFSLRYLRRAHQLLWPGVPIPPAMERAERWLLAQQMENGCFRNQGQVFHRELRGGLNEDGEIASVALTAYVITSLVESSAPLPHRVVSNTLACLRALPPLKFYTGTRVYAHSLLAYAFVRLTRYEEEIRRSNEASWLVEGLKRNEGLLEVMELVKMARKEGEYLWWDTSSLSTSIEATSYALLALRESPSSLQEFGAGAVRWLAAHRAASGGFVSTQDTLVAMEALTAWSSLQPAPANLTLVVTGAERARVDLREGNIIPEVFRTSGDSVKVKLEGAGCALIQASRSYNTLSTQQTHKRLSVQLSVHTDGEFDCDGSGNCYCAAVVEACVVWSGEFPEMALLEVTLPGGYEADAKRLYSQLHQPNSLVRRIELSSSGARATLYLSGRVSPRHACFALHAVGPRANTAPAHVRLLDYYMPSVNDTQMYTIPEDCPARITHDSSLETKDNIFNRARSLTDSGEILISPDYTFDDIPDGIPLEDPLYENLTKEKDLNKTEADNETNNHGTYSYVNKLNKADEVTDKNKTQSTELNMDNRLNVSDEKNQESKENVEKKHEDLTQKTVDQSGDEAVNYDTINAESFHKVTGNTSPQDNFVKIEQTSEHRIDIRDGEHDYHKVDNPNLSNFHVIDSEKDLEVPSGIEGPVPVLVLPPPNFIPPPNYLRAPENLNKNERAESIENFNPQETQVQSSQVAPAVALPPPNFIPPPPHVRRPEDIRSNQNYAIPFETTNPETSIRPVSVPLIRMYNLFLMPPNYVQVVTDNVQYDQSYGKSVTSDQKNRRGTSREPIPTTSNFNPPQSFDHGRHPDNSNGNMHFENDDLNSQRFPTQVPPTHSSFTPSRSLIPPFYGPQNQDFGFIDQNTFTRRMPYTRIDRNRFAYPAA